MRPLEFLVVGNLLAYSAIAAATTTKITSTTSKKVTSTSAKKASTTLHVTSSNKKPTTSSKKSRTTSRKSTTSPRTTIKPTTTSKKSTTTPKTTAKSTATKKPTTTLKTTTTVKTTITKSTTIPKTITTAKSTTKSSMISKSSSTSKSFSTTLKTTTIPKSSTQTTTRSTTTQATTNTSKPSTSSSTSTTFKPTTQASSSSSSTTASTQSTAATSSSVVILAPTPTKSTGSRGLSYNNPALTGAFSLSGQDSKVSWAYNWGSEPYFAGPWAAGTYNQVLSFVPMLWSAHPDLTSVWAANVDRSMAAYAVDAVLAFNEPDLCCATCGSSCTDVAAAVAGYRQWVQPLAGRVRLGAPAVTNGVGDNMGLSYLRRFMEGCVGCRVDFIPLHYYGSVHDLDGLQRHVEAAWEMFGRSIPIWVTEFGAAGGTEADTVAWLRVVLPWLDAQSYVERYAYFMASNAGPPCLLHENGTLTDVGKFYNSG